jgi:hypothetical protein
MTIQSVDTPEPDSLRAFIDRQMLDYRTAIPCVIVSSSADGTTVDVQPAVSLQQRIDGTRRPVALPIIRGVPVAMMGSSSLGYFVCPPLVAGDDGLLIVCDRAIDSWQFGSGIEMPPASQTPRHHDLTDAVFYPGLSRRSNAIPGYPTAALELRNRAGTVKMTLSDSGIEFTGPVSANGVPIDDTHVHGGVTPGGGTTSPPVP